MRTDEITIEVRDAQLDRVGQIKPEMWSDVLIAPLHLGAGTWSLSLPATEPEAGALATPGAGIIVTGPAGVIMSGPVAPFSRQQSPADPSGRISFTGVSDDIVLWDLLAYPDPAHAADAQEFDYDVRSGPVEMLLHELVDANVGPSALSARRGLLAQKLTSFGPDLGRGGTRESRVRFDVLGDHLVSLARIGGLGFRVVQVGDHLEFQTYAPVDRSGTIRLDVNQGTLARLEYELRPPELTRVIVAGQGEGVDRTFIERTSANAADAEAAWGRVIERFKDQRNTDVLAELEQAGDELLADGGRTIVQMRTIPQDALNVEYMTHWREGDQVAVVIDGTEPKATVSAAVISLSENGILVGAKIDDR